MTVDSYSNNYDRSALEGTRAISKTHADNLTAGPPLGGTSLPRNGCSSNLRHRSASYRDLPILLRGRPVTSVSMVHLELPLFNSKGAIPFKRIRRCSSPVTHLALHVNWNPSNSRVCVLPAQRSPRLYTQLYGSPSRSLEGMIHALMVMRFVPHAQFRSSAKWSNSAHRRTHATPSTSSFPSKYRSRVCCTSTFSHAAIRQMGNTVTSHSKLARGIFVTS